MAGNWAGSTRRGRLPPGWTSTVVPRILARDRGICYLCGRPGADTVDHVKRGDDHRDTNLAAVHDATPPHCHRGKSSREGNAARNARRGAARHPAERHPGAS
jgi:5-methylcytosine-specific restriction protein A